MRKEIFKRIKELKIFFLFILLGHFLVFQKPVYAEERFFEIRAHKFSYSPHIIRVKKGDRVRIRLISEDVTHGLFIDGYGIETKAKPGKDGSLTFTADKRGRFSFRCSVTCGEFHPYMIGYLIVEPNLRYHYFLILTGLIALFSLIWIFRKK